MNVDLKEVFDTLLRLLYSTNKDVDGAIEECNISDLNFNEPSPIDLSNAKIIRVNNKKLLPEEFELSKYDELENISDDDLYYQLERRLSLKNEIDNCIEYFKGNYKEVLNNIDDLTSILFRLIKNIRRVNGLLQHPLQDKLFETIDSASTTYLYGSSAQGIEPLRRISIDNVINTDTIHGEWRGTKVIESPEFQREWLEKDEVGYDHYLWESISHISELKKEGDMWISVDLHQNDEVLIKNFAGLLDKWRRELSIEIEKPAIGSWIVTKRKVLDYKIIPMIDLELWASVNAKKINHGVLAVVLFPQGEGEMDSFKIAQTVKPFIGKVLNKKSLEKIRWEISKETDS